MPPPEIKRQKYEEELFEAFLKALLGNEGYARRNQMRLMEEAISRVVDEILARDTLLNTPLQ